MNYKTQTNQLIITRNGELDPSFKRDIQRQQAKRTIVRAIRASQTQLLKGAWFAYARFYDEVMDPRHGTMLDEYYEVFPRPVQTRNTKGQFNALV